MAAALRLIKTSLLAGLVLWCAYPSSHVFPQKAEMELDTILEKCAEYCDRLANAVLHFVCIEKVTQEAFQGSHIALRTSGSYPIVIRTRGKLEKKEFVYDYQLYSKDNKISEVRHLLEEDGEVMKEEFSGLKDLRFEHKNVIMGPIGVLSRKWQKSHNYRILKEEKFKGDRVWVIEAVPKQGHKTGHLHGKVWISQKDYSVLRIEWNQQAIDGYERLMEDSRKWNLEPFITLISEYAFKKSGLRFPSRYELKEEYSHLGNRKFTASKKIVIYDKYKFFTVETEVKYSNLIR
jgi:hypothetical protein